MITRPTAPPSCRADPISCPDSGLYLVSENPDGTGGLVNYEGKYICCPPDNSCDAECTWIDSNTGAIDSYQTKNDFGGVGNGRNAFPGGCSDDV